MITEIISFILGVVFTTYVYNKAKWNDYKPGDYVQFRIITVMYKNDTLLSTRDRNDIDWSQVKKYSIL